MEIVKRWASWVVVAGCGVLPPDPVPPVPPVRVDEDVARIVHAWRIADHLMSSFATVSVDDARGLHGRSVDIRTAGYASPWHGSCDEDGRTRRDRILADVIIDLDLTAGDRGIAKRFGLADPIVEYRLTCKQTRVPPLTIFVSGSRAITCFNHACYLLQR